MGTQSGAAVEAGWRRGAVLSVAFFLALTATLTVLGTAAAAMGRLLTRWDAAFAIGAAVPTFVAGVVTLGGPALRRRVPDPDVRQRGGITGALLYGAAYSVATITASAGPLILLLTVATAMGRPLYGALLSLGYGIGRGLPFLALGLFAGRLAEWLGRLERGRRAAEVVSGLALLGLAIYFVRLAVVLR